MMSSPVNPIVMPPTKVINTSEHEQTSAKVMKQGLSITLNLLLTGGILSFILYSDAILRRKAEVSATRLCPVAYL